VIARCGHAGNAKASTLHIRFEELGVCGS
jgi:hypothetical protein